METARKTRPHVSPAFTMVILDEPDFGFVECETGLKIIVKSQKYRGVSF